MGNSDITVDYGLDQWRTRAHLQNWTMEHFPRGALRG